MQDQDRLDLSAAEVKLDGLGSCSWKCLCQPMKAAPSHYHFGVYFKELDIAGTAYPNVVVE